MFRTEVDTTQGRSHGVAPTPWEPKKGPKVKQTGQNSERLNILIVSSKYRHGGLDPATFYGGSFVGPFGPWEKWLRPWHKWGCLQEVVTTSRLVCSSLSDLVECESCVICRCVNVLCTIWAGASWTHVYKLQTMRLPEPFGSSALLPSVLCRICVMCVSVDHSKCCCFLSGI